MALKHPDQFAGGSEGQVKINSLFTPSLDKVKKYSEGHPRQKKILGIVADWVIQSNRPIHIVSDPKLKELIGVCDPKVELPSMYLVRTEILQKYEDVSNTIRQDF